MQDNLALWRTKIQTNTEESQKRNSLLRKEKDAIQVSWHTRARAFTSVRAQEYALVMRNECWSEGLTHLSMAQWGR